MPHFAKIENDVVTEVIVAEQSFVDTLPGRWIQTSYNTRGNIHYGPDGQPDSGVALRANYAGIGYTYNAELDAFYPPKPSILHQLNLDTYMWEINPIHDPVAFVDFVDGSYELPTPINHTVNGVSLADGSQVLFVGLVKDAGVYQYASASGQFIQSLAAYRTAIMRTNFSRVYKLVNGVWTYQIS